MAGVRVVSLIDELELDGQAAYDAMTIEIPYLTLDSTYQDAFESLRNYRNEYFAVCRETILIGAVARDDIEIVLRRIESENDEDEVDSDDDGNTVFLSEAGSSLQQPPTPNHDHDNETNGIDEVRNIPPSSLKPAKVSIKDRHWYRNADQSPVDNVWTSIRPSNLHSNPD